MAAGTAAVLAFGPLVTHGASATPSPTASVDNDTLTITGTNADEKLALRLQAGAANTLQVDFGDDGTADFSFDRTTFSHVDVSLAGGDDQFRVDQVNGAFPDEVLTVDGGPGDDTLNGGDGAETFIGGPGNDTVDGNRGNDVAFLGAGADVFRWDPGDGSDVVEGEGGTDTLEFNGANIAEKMALEANGPRVIFSRDVGNIHMDMNGVEQLDLTALGGADDVTIGDLSGTDFRRAAIDLSGSGGGDDAAIDTVTVAGTAGPDRALVGTDAGAVTVKRLPTQVDVTGSEKTDHLQINTLDGNDVVTVDGTVFAAITPDVDLGAGQA